MARIEEKSNKSKKNLASIIWTSVVVGVLVGVVVTGIVLLIIYFANNNDETEEVTYDEKYTTASENMFLTFEELNQILEPGERSEHHVSGYTFVLVYSPDYNTYDKSDKITDKVNALIAKCDDNGHFGDDAFYIVNVESEDNKDYEINSYSNLTSLSSTSYPYLLVISPENGDYEILEEEGIISTWREINNKLTELIGE